MLAARYQRMDADVDLEANIRTAWMCGARSVGDDLSDRLCPTLQREDDFEPKVGAVNRRHRPSPVREGRRR
jgi:hypothetical protein